MFINNRQFIITLFFILVLTHKICHADDWPQFRGPNRDGKSAETGLLKKWPAGGPKLLWSVDGLGTGFSSVAIAKGFIYTTGLIERECILFAYNLEGKLQWKVSCGPGWRRSYPGTRTTPTINDGRVYLFSGTGVLSCFDAKTGKKIWDMNTLKKFHGKNKRWGMSESILVDGEKIYCTPCGKKGTMVALNKKTGKTIWASKGLDESSAYSSPILIERGPNNLLITMIQRSIICINADTGEHIWRIPHKTSYDTAIITPVYKNGRFFVASVVENEYINGGIMFELSPDGRKVTRKWNSPTLDCHHGGVVLVDGYLYGAGFDGLCCGSWVCLEWNTGKVMYDTLWNDNKGSIIYADGMLYCYDEKDGNVALVKASPKGFNIISSFKITQGSGKHWAHPAISDGRLYIRHGDVLMAYDIKRKR